MDIPNLWDSLYQFTYQQAYRFYKLHKVRCETAGVTHDDIKLFSGHIPLSSKDLETLGAKHKCNPVMTKVIVKYAQDNKIEYYSTSPTDDMKKETFNDKGST